MSSGRFFCAALSQVNREWIYATVARVDSWLLLEHCGPWRRNALEGSNLLEEVKDGLKRIQTAAPTNRQLLIRQGYKRFESIRCFLVDSREIGSRMIRIELTEYDELVDKDLRKLEDDPGAQSIAGPMYAVCTHGTHDKCCSKFGLPVYRALRDQEGERVWQCSHVGGDRFAANVVVFPYGIYYGRLLPEEVPEFVRICNRGEICLKNYRGRCVYPRVAQAGEYFVRSESGRMRIEEFRLAGVERNLEGVSRVRFEARSDSTLHEVEFRASTERLSEYLSCGAVERTPITQYEMIRYSVNRKV